MDLVLEVLQGKCMIHSLKWMIHSSGSGGSAGNLELDDTQFKVDDTQFWFWRFCKELGVG